MTPILLLALSATLGLADETPPPEGDAGSALPGEAATAAAAASAPEIDLPALEYFEPLMARLEQAARFDRSVGMAIAVLEHGEPVLIYTAGETAAGSGEMITADTQFRAASLSKGFTGVLLALLEHGPQPGCANAGAAPACAAPAHLDGNPDPSHGPAAQRL